MKLTQIWMLIGELQLPVSFLPYDIISSFEPRITAMISELAEGAQFIVTTYFRPELLAHADSHFGVIFDARKSIFYTVNQGK